MSYDIALNQRLLRSPLNTLCDDPIAMLHVKHRWLQGLELTLQWRDTQANRAALAGFVHGLRDGDLARHVFVKFARGEEDDDVTHDPDGEDHAITPVMPGNDHHARCNLRITGVDMETIRRRVNRLMQAVPGADRYQETTLREAYEIRPQDIGQQQRQR